MHSSFPRFAIKIKGGGTLVLDHFKLAAGGGTGGTGLSKFGGIGGKGADVYLVAKSKYTLSQMETAYPKGHIGAASGRNSRKFCLIGEKGKDTEVRVPVGITVSTHDGHVLGELNKSGEKMMVATGGEGGSAATNYRGTRGTRMRIQLDLKLIADIGLVGFPNAGKSTLLSSLSRAKPKIASYPFTTVRPQIGMMEFDDLRQISVADLPGLIEGAHRNVGMGHRFLKHVERTLLLLFVVDINGFQLNPDWPFRNAIETVLLLNKEVELYNPELLLKPCVLCINKVDSVLSPDTVDHVLRDVKSREDYANEILPEELRPKKLIRFHDILPISAMDKRSVQELRWKLRSVLDEVDNIRRQNKGWGQERFDDDMLRALPAGSDLV